MLMGSRTGQVWRAAGQLEDIQTWVTGTHWWVVCACLFVVATSPYISGLITNCTPKHKKKSSPGQVSSLLWNSNWAAWMPWSTQLEGFKATRCFMCCMYIAYCGLTLCFLFSFLIFFWDIWQNWEKNVNKLAKLIIQLLQLQIQHYLVLLLNQTSKKTVILRIVMIFKSSFLNVQNNNVQLLHPAKPFGFSQLIILSKSVISGSVDIFPAFSVFSNRSRRYWQLQHDFKS